MIASVNCRTSNRWEEFIHRLEKAGADAIELNINLLSSDARLAGPELEARYEELLAQVRETATVPVALKLGYHFSALAAFLFRNLGRLLSRGHLLEAVWGRNPDLATRTVDTHISRVRSKLNLRPENGFRLTPTYNFGYRLEKIDPSESPAIGEAAMSPA